MRYIIKHLIYRFFGIPTGVFINSTACQQQMRKKYSVFRQHFYIKIFHLFRRKIPPYSIWLVAVQNCFQIDNMLVRKEKSPQTDKQ